MTQWIYFILLSICGYLGVSVFSHLVGTAPSLMDSIKGIFKPLPLLCVLVTNICLASAVYFGFLASSTAIPIMLSVGIVTSLVYSVFFLGVTITSVKLLGVLFIVVGIYLLK